MSKSICYVVNHATFFLSHRLNLALSAQALGYKVKLLVGNEVSQSMSRESEKKLLQNNIDYKHLPFSSVSLNIFKDILALIKFYKEIKIYKPTIIHAVTPKSILMTGIISKFINIDGIVMAISGFGYLIATDSRKFTYRCVIKKIYLYGLKLSFNHKNLIIIVQNVDDKNFLLDNYLALPKQIRLIAGSGIKIESDSNICFKSKKKYVVFPARLIKEKGIYEFYNASKRLKYLHPNWRFIIAGAADYQSPSQVPLNLLRQWQDDGTIEWFGYVDNIRQLFIESTIVCLPSYREGLPKALLEASAAGCAVVTTDVAGCRDSIIPGITGDLVQVKNIDALVGTLNSLMTDMKRCEQYGLAGIKFVAEKFDIKIITSETISLYEELQRN